MNQWRHYFSHLDTWRQITPLLLICMKPTWRHYWFYIWSHLLFLLLLHMNPFSPPIFERAWRHDCSYKWTHLTSLLSNGHTAKKQCHYYIKTTSRCRFGVIMMFLLFRVFAGLVPYIYGSLLGIALNWQPFVLVHEPSLRLFQYRNPPILKMLTSPAVLCILLMNATDGFAFYVIFNCGAIYLSKILGFGIQYVGSIKIT